MIGKMIQKNIQKVLNSFFLDIFQLLDKKITLLC